MSKEIKLPKKLEKKIKDKNIEQTGSKVLAKAFDAVGAKKPKGDKN